MASLLSGSALRSGGSGEFIDLPNAMPQLPATDTTLTGFTLVTNAVLQTSYRSSLGFVEFTESSMYSALPDGTVHVLATGTTFLSTTTSSGNLVVEGGIGVGGNMHIEEDIVVNGITIGTGWEGQNNIVIRGTAEEPSNSFLNGQESIAIGYSTLEGIETSYKDIAIGRFALSSGTKISNSIAIGDSALKLIGTVDSFFVGNITAITSYAPILTLTVLSHGLSTGTNIVINDVLGTIELNDTPYWIDIVDNNTIELYSNNILSIPVDGTSYTGYISGGTVGITLNRNNNIAIGNNAGENLLDGQKNFFFGDLAAKNLTTGSNNFIIGSDVGGNLTSINGTISIGGDNIVDGIDNQIAIGSVFYYNGAGQGTLNADFEIGSGTESTSSTSGALTVVGGAGVQRDLYVGEELHVASTSTFSDNLLPGNTSVDIGSAELPFRTLYLQGSTLYLSTVTLKSADDLSFSIESTAGDVTQTVGNLVLNSGDAATSIYDGSLNVTGGAGVQGDLFVGGQFSITGTEDITLSPAGADVFIQPTIGGTVYISPSVPGNIDNMIIGATNPADATFDNISCETINNVNSTATSTSTTTGAVIVSGGVGIAGDIYAATGNPELNYLLYTPRVTVQLTTPPLNPRLNDIWIDPGIPAYMQYIKDGNQSFWIQVGSI